MDGVSWSTTRSQESFSRSTAAAAETLSRLASFISQAEAKHHTRAQRQLPPHLPSYSCKECSKAFSCAADLRQHRELKHSLPKPHRCPTCGLQFSLKSSLQLHRCESGRCELCRGPSRIGSPCSSCTSRASDPGRPQEKPLHRQPHLLDSSPYTCAPCGRGFSHKQALLHHQQAGCTEPPKADDSPPASEGDSTRSDSSDTPGPSRTANVCHLRSRSFRSDAGLQRLRPTGQTEDEQNAGGEARKEKNNKSDGAPRSKMKLLTCRSCDKVFRSTSKLYVHRREKHSRDKHIRREARPTAGHRGRGDALPCQICSKVFFHHRSLRAHYRQHTAWSLQQAVRRAAKESRTPEKSPNKAAGNKTGKTGPGRPRRESKEAQRCREVPEEKEEEEVEEIEEEEEEEVEEEVEEDAEEEEEVEAAVEEVKEVEEVEVEVEVEEEEEEEEEFPCPSCAEVFSLQWQLKDHVELHQSSVRRRHCSVCRSSVDSCRWPSSRRQRLYHCVPCQHGFSALDSFLEHCQEHLRARVEEDRILEAGKA